MKTFILLFLILSGQFCFSQELLLYRDSVKNFSIGLPKGWKYQVINDAQKSVRLTVFRSKDNEPDTLKVSFNVAIMPFDNYTIDLAYTNMLQSIGRRAGFKLISEGDTTIEGQKYKWLVEQHANSKTGEPMTAYIYLGYKAPNAYMVTFATITTAFENYVELFKRIGTTFRL